MVILNPPVMIANLKEETIRQDVNIMYLQNGTLKKVKRFPPVSVQDYAVGTQGCV
jgi:hypothetical protein